MVLLVSAPIRVLIGDDNGPPSDEYTEDVLSAHESELDRMRGFYSDNADLFKLVEKRQSLWGQKLEFEVSERWQLASLTH